MIPFKVGDKVVCVDADDTTIDGRQELNNGGIYTIRRVGSCERHNYKSKYPANSICVWLREITAYGRDIAPFAAARFRPVAERKTDISTFTAMLNIKQRELSQ